MSISYEQLEKWRRRGDDKKSSKTYDFFVKILKEHCSDIIEVNDDNVFLQGSYVNHTNIKDDSDIDIVVLAKNVFYNNAKEVLNETQYKQFKERYSDSSKRLEEFKEQIYKKLNGIKIQNNVYMQLKRGCKTIKFNEGGNLMDFVPVDIVPAFEYRKYSGYNGINKENQVEGIEIYDACKDEYIINYPKLHIENGKNKDSETRTDCNYKETIRIFKQIRNCLIDTGVIREELMPSYALECLLYNVPDTLFKKNLVERVDSIIEWLSQNLYKEFIEQNGMYYLFTPSNGKKEATIKREDAKLFIERCIWLSKNWR